MSNPAERTMEVARRTMAQLAIIVRDEFHLSGDKSSDDRAFTLFGLLAVLGAVDHDLRSMMMVGLLNGAGKRGGDLATGEKAVERTIGLVREQLLADLAAAGIEFGNWK